MLYCFFYFKVHGGLFEVAFDENVLFDGVIFSIHFGGKSQPVPLRQMSFHVEKGAHHSVRVYDETLLLQVSDRSLRP